VSNQALKTGVIVLDSVTAAQDGWVVVYRKPGFTASDIVGYAPVYQGTNYGVKVTVDTAKRTTNHPSCGRCCTLMRGSPTSLNGAMEVAPMLIRRSSPLSRPALGRVDLNRSERTSQRERSLPVFKRLRKVEPLIYLKSLGL